MNPDECPYCGQDPCTCPMFDLPDETEEPDNPICPDHENDPEPQLLDIAYPLWEPVDLRLK